MRLTPPPPSTTSSSIDTGTRPHPRGQHHLADARGLGARVICARRLANLDRREHAREVHVGLGSPAAITCEDAQRSAAVRTMHGPTPQQARCGRANLPCHAPGSGGAVERLRHQRRHSQASARPSQVACAGDVEPQVVRSTDRAACAELGSARRAMRPGARRLLGPHLVRSSPPRDHRRRSQRGRQARSRVERARWASAAAPTCRCSARRKLVRRHERSRACSP